jgi:hypothetical protein
MSTTALFVDAGRIEKDIPVIEAGKVKNQASGRGCRVASHFV